MNAPAGVLITAEAAALLAGLQDRHGPVMFHQSGGCCDGSAPMCYPRADFLVGDRDILLGVLDVGEDGVPVWISGPQYQAWKHTQLIIDVVPGRGGGFSLEAPEGVRFLSRGRVFSDAGDHRRSLRVRRTTVSAGSCRRSRRSRCHAGSVPRQSAVAAVRS